MGKSRNREGVQGKEKNKINKENKEAYQTCTGQTVTDAWATARRAIAITRGGLEAAKGITTGH